MKLKNLLSESVSESVYKADEKFDVVVLERKQSTYSYFADPMYVFMDADYNQFEVEKDNMGEGINFLEDGMQCEVVFYDDREISVELPNTVVREILYTEPAVRGDPRLGENQHRFFGAGAAVLPRAQDRDRRTGSTSGGPARIAPNRVRTRTGFVLEAAIASLP